MAVHRKPHPPDSVGEYRGHVLVRLVWTSGGGGLLQNGDLADVFAGTGFAVYHLWNNDRQWSGMVHAVDAGMHPADKLGQGH